MVLSRANTQFHALYRVKNPTARPLAFNIALKNSLSDCYGTVKETSDMKPLSSQDDKADDPLDIIPESTSPESHSSSTQSATDSPDTKDEQGKGSGFEADSAELKEGGYDFALPDMLADLPGNLLGEIEEPGAPSV
ncbi:hypothetical protein QFC21_002097 [Naganishia friedmannii]|uniref:Uncharacterized protein n=1 Tax=Naganishia friedmannii TaxID=89922 RepID=A0ACC2VZV3_9TREE|nr:hypothetical protein QFC21_002097 [Naganishia friedmannii]